VVEDEGGEAGLGESLGERTQPVASRPREPVRHDYDRCDIAGGLCRVEPGSAPFVARYEGDLLAIHRRSNGRDREFVRPSGSVPRFRGGCRP
jgi:hypothetical protein